MKRSIYCLAFLVFSFSAFTQKQYFIYFESEAQQPFYVKFGEKLYNSSSSGYLILSKLKDSSYSISIGFPQDKWPEQQFSVAVRAKDRGFILKNLGEKGWGLYDLQTSSLQMATDAAKDRTGKTGQQNVSMFTLILSKAANDPSLTEKPVSFAKSEAKPPVVQPAVIKDDVKERSQEPVSSPVVASQKQTKADSTLLVTAKETTKKDAQVTTDQQRAAEGLVLTPQEIKKSPDTSFAVVPDTKKATMPVVKADSSGKLDEKKAPPSTKAYKRSVVTRKSETSTTEGFGLVFIDEIDGGQKDTIRILIAEPKTAFANTSNTAEEKSQSLKNTTENKEKPASVNTDVRNSCSSTASGDDFLKLRKKMASQKSDEEMINESRKAFKTKCFTTEQVKNLGNLFLNEAAKFQFYEAAFPFASDRENFGSLQGEFKDAYFVHRFKKFVD